MQRQNIIVIIDEYGTVECWGNLKKACKAHGWVYNTIVQKKMPIDHDGWEIQRIPFR